MFTRSEDFRRTKPYYEGISGKGKTNSGLSQQRGTKLFTSIVTSAGGVAYKRSQGKKGLCVAERFVNFKTRGKAVAIGPLEYCGNGIPLKRSGRDTKNPIL